MALSLAKILWFCSPTDSASTKSRLRSHVSTAVKAEWQRTKEGASLLYGPKKGGRYEIFNERPMRPEIVQYCTRDVAPLLGLYDVYNAKLCPPRGGGAFWRVQVRERTKDRIKLSQSPGYNGQA
jgi:exonuclease 3'-5' domain-containing protein 1